MEVWTLAFLHDGARSELLCVVSLLRWRIVDYSNDALIPAIGDIERLASLLTSGKGSRLRRCFMVESNSRGRVDQWTDTSTQALVAESGFFGSAFTYVLAQLRRSVKSKNLCTGFPLLEQDCGQ